MNDLVATWEASGVREFIVLTAHEHDPHLEALSTLITKFHGRAKAERVECLRIAAPPGEELPHYLGERKLDRAPQKKGNSAGTSARRRKTKAQQSAMAQD